MLMSNLFAKLKCSPRREYIHLNDWRKIGHWIKSTSNFTSNYRPLCMVLIFIAEPGIKSSTKCIINWYLKLFYQISRLISLHYLWIRPSKMCRNTSFVMKICRYPKIVIFVFTYPGYFLYLQWNVHKHSL